MLETGEKFHYESQQADHIGQRIKLFFKSYGEAIPENFLDMVLLRLEALCKTMKRKANEGEWI